MDSYGQLIARLRKARGWSQEDLAREAGVPKRTIQDVELDKVTKPQRSTRQKLDMALEIEGSAEGTRREFPADVQVFTDVIGAFLSTFSEAERLEIMRRITTSEIVQNKQQRRPNGQPS